MKHTAVASTLLTTFAHAYGGGRSNYYSGEDLPVDNSQRYFSDAAWTQKAYYPGQPRHHPVTFANQTHGFLLTGSILGRNGRTQNSKDFYVYNPQDDTWVESEVEFPGAARSFAYGVTLGEFAYLGFGTSDRAYLNDWWSYNFKTQEFKRLADCPGVGRRHPAMVEVPGKIYVGLGDGVKENGKWDNLADFWEYNISTDTWTQVDDIPGVPRHHPYYFGIGDTVYAGLGHSRGGIENDWYKLDSKTNVWTKLKDFMSIKKGGHRLTSEARVAGTQGRLGKYGFVLSGDGDDHGWMKTGEFHVYEPQTDTWMAMPPHPGFSRWAPGNFVIGSQVFFTSGVDRRMRNIHNDMWAIDLGQFLSSSSL